MEKYFGSKLIFKTPTCTYKGILKTIDYSTNTLTIQEDNSNNLKKINILDIEDLQVMVMPNKKHTVSQFQNIKTSIRLNESLSKMSINDKQNDRCETKNSVRKEPVKSATSRMRSIIDVAEYKKVLADTIQLYGPSEEAFSYNVARIVHNFLLKQKHETFLIVIGDSFYSKIGLCLCKMFKNTEIVFDAICTVENDVRFCKEVQYYKNSGGTFAMKRSNYDHIIIFGKTDITYEYTKNCYMFEEENKQGNKNIVLFMLGMVQSCFSNFNGIIYLIDCNLSTVLYEKHGIKNKCNGDITQIKK